MKFCYKCGKQLNEDVAFCTKCGTKLDYSFLNNNTNSGSDVHNIDRNINHSNINTTSVISQKCPMRTSMKIWAVLCFIFAGLYLIIGITQVREILSMTALFSVLGIMFLILGKSPKKNPYLFGRSRGMKKKTLVWVSIIVAFALYMIILLISVSGAPQSNSETSSPNQESSSIETKKGNDEKNNKTHEKDQTTSAKSVFDGDCGISASAEIGNNIINYPELKITITNTTNKEISAIKFYAVPYDVYGEEINLWTTQKNLYTDNAIPAGRTKTISYQFIEQSVKTVKLYVYSVYFEDGTEWGDRNATSSKITKNAPTINVTVNS